jgi:hypothetical protein
MPSNKKLLQAAAGNAGESLYVEDVFSTYLYEGNGSTQTITNGIDLDGEGGMVWVKDREGTGYHVLMDTERGIAKQVYSNSTNAENNNSDGPTSFNSDGFSLGAWSFVNSNTVDFASWTFRKAEKFFDVVTYTGNGLSGRTVSHNLGSVPGMIIVKALAGAEDWAVYHRGNTANPETDYLELNTTNATADSAAWWNDTAPTDTEFTLGNDGAVNGNTVGFVAYLFASDAGGFGDDGSESIIKCGSYTGNGSTTGPEIDLGFEPQWVMVKRTNSTGNWLLLDVMRGFGESTDNELYANLSLAEGSGLNWARPFATGFQPQDTMGDINASGGNYIYIAIRRPMKTPESGTEVYNTITRTGTGSIANVTGVGFPLDFMTTFYRSSAQDKVVFDRMRGPTQYLNTAGTTQEINVGTNGLISFDMDGFTTNAFGYANNLGTDFVNHCFKRATGFFDVVAYTGTGVARTVTHNLGVVPELMIVKNRNSAFYGWSVYHSATGNTKRLEIDTTSSANSVISWNNTTPTETVFTLGDENGVNRSAYTYISYLFATLAGVSKVGSYTGTGADLNVDCGFSAGARFILIKRTDSTGDWYVWDSARGIVAGNDPYLLLNTTAAEVTSTDYIDPLSSGFTVTSSAPAALNASGGTYIFLAIA